jgi:hypothetical protein
VKSVRRTRETGSAISTSNWQRRLFAAMTTALMAMYSVAPAWAAGPVPAKAKAAVAPASPGESCQLNSPRGHVKHVVTIIFDNTHFQRDPARDGSFHWS